MPSSPRLDSLPNPSSPKLVSMKYSEYLGLSTMACLLPSPRYVSVMVSVPFCEDDLESVNPDRAACAWAESVAEEIRYANGAYCVLANRIAEELLAEPPVE